MLGRAVAATVPLALGILLGTHGAKAQPELPPDAAIVVAGNRHVDADAVRAEFRNSARGRLDDAALDSALKGLYATNLFADVRIAREGDHVTVTVVENPTIGRVAFDGNRKIKDEELSKLIQSKAGGPLSRPLVHDDVERILEAYRLHGYFQAKVEPKTIAAKSGSKSEAKTDPNKAAGTAANQDRAALVFEIKEGDKLAVREVAFAGNNAFAAAKLKGEIKTGESNVLSFLFDNDIYDADRMESDRALIRHFYLTRGYADVNVRAAASYQAEKQGVVVTFTIDEGPQYRFGKVSIESRLKTVDAAKLSQYLRTREGDVYNSDAVDKTVEDATTALARNGEPFAAVLARPARLPERHLVNLVYAIAEGNRVYIERIEIHGDTKTHDDVIRREFDVVEGDPYNKALIDRAERRLKALGFFKTVKIETQPGSAPDQLIVSVTVEEQATGTFSISGGYSTSAGFLAEASVGDQNFLGTGLAAKVSVTYGQYSQGGTISLTDPYIFDQHISLGGQLFANQTLANEYQSFDSAIYGAKLIVGTPIDDQLGLQYSYSIYNQSLSLDPANGPSSLPVQLAAAAGPMWVSSIGNGVTYSTLDNPKSPTNGVRAQFNTELAGVGGAVKFARTTDDVRYYHEIMGDVVGMARAQGGYVTPWGGQQLPLIDNFFGGPQLVRGFAPNGFGPRDITSGSTQDNVGGNVYWTTTAELQAPVPFIPADAQLKVALFADAGSLWANSASGISNLSSLTPAQQIANSQAIRASVGGSLIWNSMFGPIRVDYAFPVAKQPYDVVQNLNFTAGGF
jgi:outer membrane protein insertion porin family